MRELRKEILVLGIGNTLLSDEGIGVYIVNELAKAQLPANVELLDGGTAGADLLDVISDRKKLIIVDAIEGDFPSGTIVRFGKEGIESIFRNAFGSLHDLNISETLAMTSLLRCEPEIVVFVGVKPFRVQCNTNITYKMSCIVPDILEVVMSEIKMQP